MNRSEFLVGHAVATSVYIILFLVLPGLLALALLVILLVGMILINDAGGPLVFPK